MQMKWMLALAAATALMPAAAIAQENRGREGRSFERSERAAPRADRGQRFGGGQRGNVERPVRPAFRNDAPRAQARAERRAERVQQRQATRTAPTAGRPAVRAERRDDRRGFRAERRDDRQAFRVERRDDRQALRGGTVNRQQFLRDRQQDQRAFRQDRRDDRQDFRADRRDDRRDWRGREGNRDWRRDDRPRGLIGQGERRWYGDNDWGNRRDRDRRDWNRGDWNRGGWNRDWRRDRRYDWRGYRTTNRNLYRLPRYYAPSGWGRGYQRFGIGFSLSSVLFGPDYWINDPFNYRLPDAYGPYRWVRYYNDALLVDFDTGEVVDVEHDIFW
ncbi:RcnB family protein [Sphingomonas sp.]|uniref:RcnB family protein n=1 Tax=Sphingomonas sp. TaxID=28214 RepID=UPI002BDBFE00|nr:RcnB family protein [Sphingomonas sp.]HTG37399.1 RcnB family protein [Sphingomonas sp.]